jgi:D-glycero-D-manno-heptose 1,7-bisphosphate phosphatase
MIDRAARDLNVDVKKSYVVGDKWSDVELGQRAGAHTILVRSGFAADSEGKLRPGHLMDPEFIARTITEAIEWILQHGTRDHR